MMATKTRKRERFDDVSQMVRAISDDDEFTKALEERLASREVIKNLMAMRATKGISQAEIAKNIGCSQSRISKLENGVDSDIRLIDLHAYADVLGLELSLVFGKPQDTIVDEVKYHAFRIKDLMRRLAGLARQDEAIAKGVADFFNEAFFNLLKIIQDSANRLPPQENGSHFIRIEVQEASAADYSQGEDSCIAEDCDCEICTSG